jgi:hypothetical protein
MTLLAAATPRGLRPDAWNFPLLLHVLGATVMVGALILAASALIFAWRDGNPALVRLGFRALLIGALPAFIVMRAGAEWIASKEDLTDSNASWIGIGFTTSDAGLVLILISILLAGLGVRRLSRGGAAGALGRVPAALASILVVAFLVTVWAMTTKPA